MFPIYSCLIMYVIMTDEISKLLHLRHFRGGTIYSGWATLQPRQWSSGSIKGYFGGIFEGAFEVWAPQLIVEGVSQGSYYFLMIRLVIRQTYYVYSSYISPFIYSAHQRVVHLILCFLCRLNDIYNFVHSYLQSYLVSAYHMH